MSKARTASHGLPASLLHEHENSGGGGRRRAHRCKGEGQASDVQLVRPPCLVDCWRGRPVYGPVAAICSWAPTSAFLSACTWWPLPSPVTLMTALVTAGSTASAEERG